MNNKKIVWLNTFLVIIFNFLLMIIVYGINKYGSLSKKIFIAINAALLILNIVIIFYTIRTNNKKSSKVKYINSFILVLLVSMFSYGVYVINAINSNIDNLTYEDGLIDYYGSFVVYNNANGDLEDYKFKTLGLINSSDFIEGNVLPKDTLEQLEYDSVDIQYFDSYTQAMFALVNNEVDFISLPANYKEIYSTHEDISPYLINMTSIYNFSGKYDNFSKVSGSDINVTESPFTVLIMGNDGGRTDSLMLASFNPKSMQVTLTSIARDSYVPIACYTNQARDKINHARFVSRDCSIKTVENLLDISIDFYFEINFEGLVDVVNALGTIPIDSPKAFHGNKEVGEKGGVFIPEGLSELDGHQMLAFVRERNSFADGDFQRQKNQQQAIKAIIKKVTETRDVQKMINIIKAASDNINTNVSLSQMIDILGLAINQMENSFLNNADLFTIYGNRITGRGVMIYTPGYNKELYYYVLYDGSIADSRDLITLNMREDGILNIPTGFNYSFLDGFTTPIFGKDIYMESIDPSINENSSKPEPEDEIKENEPEDEILDPNDEIEEEEVVEEVIEIEMKNFIDQPLDVLMSFINENNLKYDIVNVVEINTDKIEEDNLQFVKSQSVVDGSFNLDDTLIIEVNKYIYTESEE